MVDEEAKTLPTEIKTMPTATMTSPTAWTSRENNAMVYLSSDQTPPVEGGGRVCISQKPTTYVGVGVCHIYRVALLSRSFGSSSQFVYHILGMSRNVALAFFCA